MKGKKKYEFPENWSEIKKTAIRQGEELPAEMRNYLKKMRGSW